MSGHPTKIRVGLIGTPEEIQSLPPELARLCARAFADIGQMLSDQKFLAKVRRQWLDAGPVSEMEGFNWYMDPMSNLATIEPANTATSSV